MEEYIIDKAHQLEVDIERLPLSYAITLPSKINSETTPIVVLGGYGEYANSEYMKSLHESLTSKYNVAIIGVNYTGIFTKTLIAYENQKPYEFLNTTLKIDNENKRLLLNILYGLLNNSSEVIDFLIKKGNINSNDFSHFKRTISLLISKLENNFIKNSFEIIERLYELGFTSTIVKFILANKNEHNDFGLIQAIDVLTVIQNLRQNQKYEDLNWKKLCVVGSSHGAYVASMCDKIAPNTFNRIINNAGWIEPYRSELFDITLNLTILSVSLNLLVDNIWSEDPNSPNYYSQRHHEIRCLNNLKQVQEQVDQTFDKDNKIYIFAHTINDQLISMDNKTIYIDLLSKYYNSIIYKKLEDESDLDGQTFKSLIHGGNASLKGLIIDYVIHTEFNKEIEQNDFDRESTITYSTSLGDYVISYAKENFPTVTFKSS